MVLIHGWPLSAESWKAQTPALQQAGYRVVAYDRRGFGRSEKKGRGLDYDTLAEDLEGVLGSLELRDVTLVGFSMGGGEVARYITEFGEERLRSVGRVASAVTPYMLHGVENPEGPLTKEKAASMAEQLAADDDAFYEQFTKEFFSVNGELKVTEAQRQEALTLCHQASQKAALKAMASFGATDFRDDLAHVTVPTLVLHGEGDATVPFEGSGRAHPPGDRAERARRHPRRAARVQRQPRRPVQRGADRLPGEVARSRQLTSVPSRSARYRRQKSRRCRSCRRGRGRELQGCVGRCPAR